MKCCWLPFFGVTVAVFVYIRPSKSLSRKWKYHSNRMLNAEQLWTAYRKFIIILMTWDLLHSVFFHRISGDSPLLNTEIFAQSVTYTDTWFSLGVLMNAPLNWLNSWLFSSRRSVLKEWGALVKRFESGQEPEGLWQRLNDTIEICIKYTWNGFHCFLIASMEIKSHGTRKKTKTVPRKELTTFIVVFFWWLFCYTTSVNLSILHMSVDLGVNFHNHNGKWFSISHNDTKRHKQHEWIQLYFAWFKDPSRN